MANVLVVNARAVVFSWPDGYKARREETLLEQARKSEDELLRVCLWLENHGREEEALLMLERLLT